MVRYVVLDVMVTVLPRYFSAGYLELWSGAVSKPC